MVAQSEVLGFGRPTQQLREAGTPEELLLHKAMPGNRPNNVLIADELSPQSVGQLIALYEHKTFVQGVVWGVNSFDQWGVEFGKKLARSVAEEMKVKKKETKGHDPSTNTLIDRLKS